MSMRVQPRYTNYVISFSFKNYLKAKSGMPKVIMAHQMTINYDEVSYVYLYSVKKMFFRNKKILFCDFGLIVDGVDYGVFPMNRLIRFFYDWNEMGYALVNFHIHHLLYTSLDKIKLLVDSFPTVPVNFFLHDYYLCCISYHLMSVDGYYCGARSLSREYCSNCTFFSDSVEYENRLHQFIAGISNRVLFIAPSQATQGIYANFLPTIKDKIIVIPHQRLIGNYMGNTEHIMHDEPIRVGYLGVPQGYKGWDIWERVVEATKHSNDYDFYVFNNSKNTDYGRAKHVNVEFSQTKQNAMVDAIRENKINMVLLWPRTPETYSYTCMEAYASNAYIITNGISGNIQDFVRNNQAGRVLNNESELLELFSAPKLVRDEINSFYLNKKPAPLTLAENDKICSLYKDLVKKEEIIDSNYIVKKTLRSYIMEIMYGHFVKKY